MRKSDTSNTADLKRSSRNKFGVNWCSERRLSECRAIGEVTCTNHGAISRRAEIAKQGIAMVANGSENNIRAVTADTSV